MRRFFAFFLLLGFLIPPALAAERPKYVAITFDDGPSGRYTAALLEGLSQRHVHATFFLCGYRLRTFQNLAQQIRENGHEIGLHGYTHDSMAKMNLHGISQELTETASLLPDGYYVNLMRPPGGMLTPDVRTAAKQQHLAIAHWSVDPKDWATDDTSLIVRRVLDQVKDGDVILMHDMTDSSVEAALTLVDELHSRGFQFLTVSQLAMLRLYHLQSGEKYNSFPVIMKEG